jgi:outer membrane protein assembly factor BamE
VHRLEPVHENAFKLIAAGAVLGTALLLGLIGCAQDRSRSGLFEPYKISIPQGNYVTQTMLAQVREGMTREQVRFVLGTPLVQDVFHPNRWDYVFRFQHPNGDADLRHASVFFESEKVKRVEQIDLPVRDDLNDPALPGVKSIGGRGGRNADTPDIKPPGEPKP